MIDFNEKQLQKAILLAPTPNNRERPVLPTKTVRVTFEVQTETLPALYSAIEEISNEIGSRLEAPHRYHRQDALTLAARALGGLRSGLAETFRTLARTAPRDRRWHSPLGDPDYR